jgi:hypothetical protein
LSLQREITGFRRISLEQRELRSGRKRRRARLPVDVGRRVNSMVGSFARGRPPVPPSGAVPASETPAQKIRKCRILDFSFRYAVSALAFRMSECPEKPVVDKRSTASPEMTALTGSNRSGL